MTDPIDHAALLLLRKLVADLEHGRVFCTKLVAGDDATDLSLALAWKLQAPASPPSPSEPALHAGDSCPTCGAMLRATSSRLMCPRCGPAGQLSGE